MEPNQLLNSDNLLLQPEITNNYINEELNTHPLFLNNFVFQEYTISTITKKKIVFFPNECFYMLYCWSGSLLFSTNGKTRRIRPQESAIIYDALGKGASLEIDKNASTRFFAIGFNRPQQLREVNPPTCFFKFKQIFKDCVAGNHTYFIGKTNLEIFERINTLTQIAPNSIADEFMVEGILFQVYSLKMTQMLSETQTDTKAFRGFSCWEIEQLQNISETIAENPGKEYTVEYLCRKSGLGPNKLQRGFKKMHKRTVIDYIRNVRLEKSVELIKTTNMSISEIVYSVGLSSRSYFSKIFKMKYKCSPKHFQQMQRE